MRTADAAACSHQIQAPYPAYTTPPPSYGGQEGGRGKLLAETIVDSDSEEDEKEGKKYEREEKWRRATDMNEHDHYDSEGCEDDSLYWLDDD